MKQLFFASIFFFSMFFGAQSAVAAGAMGDPCVGENKVGFSGTCQTYATCGGDINNIDSSSDCSSSSGLLCCKGSGAAGTPTDPNDVACLSQPVGGPCPRADGKAGVCEQISGGGKTCLEKQSSGGTTSSGGSTTNSGTFPGSASTGTSGTTPCVGGVVQSGICFPTGTGLSSDSVGSLLMRLMSWLLAVFGMIAIIAFVISGIQYLISAGDETMMETAKHNMQYSIIGVIVGLSGWVIIMAIDHALGGGGVCLLGVICLSPVI